MSLELDQKLYHLARLQIDNVAKGDAGEYRAVAKNKHGQGVATINLNFEGGDKLKYASITVELGGRRVARAFQNLGVSLPTFSPLLGRGVDSFFD